MTSEPHSSQVVHKRSENRYELTVNGARATLDYHIDDRHMVITHTFVPPALRGGGIAAELVRSALADARKDGHKVRSECSYVSAYLERHAAQYADLNP